MLKAKEAFEFVGTFTAICEWRDGLPRRIQVVRENAPLVLKVTKELRERFLDIAPGTELLLRGVEKTSGGAWKRKLTGVGQEVRPGFFEQPEITIQICGKKNCWKRGGRDLFENLEARISEKRLTHVRLEKTGCLGNCKECPTACVPAHDLLLGRASPQKLDHFLPA